MFELLNFGSSQVHAEVRNHLPNTRFLPNWEHLRWAQLIDSQQ
jgi:hypothetical protein